MKALSPLPQKNLTQKTLSALAKHWNSYIGASVGDKARRPFVDAMRKAGEELKVPGKNMDEHWNATLLALDSARPGWREQPAD